MKQLTLSVSMYIIRPIDHISPPTLQAHHLSSEDALTLTYKCDIMHEKGIVFFILNMKQ